MTARADVQAPDKPATLDISDVTVRFGQHRVLEGCSLRVRPGELVTLVGHNGAGKTTLLRTIVGLNRPLQGTITFGDDLRTESPARRARRGLAFVPDAARGPVFGALSVRDNLRLAEETAAAGAEVSDALLQTLFPPIFDRMERAVAALSGGQRQMVAVAMALKRRPRLLLLDEPSVGLAPVLVEQMMEAVRRIKDELGIGVLVVEQNVRAAIKESDRVAVLKQGRVTHQLVPSEIRDVQQLWEYF
jgi:branched-chain amino acid transport system ATP-binding protein